MRTFLLASFATLTLLLASTKLTGGELVPFILPWDDGAASAVSQNILSDAPTGKAGPLTVDAQGHFSEGGKRVRIIGVNICAANAYCAKDLAEKCAARLAKFGVNCVRFHHMDYPWGTPSIFKRGQTWSRTLDPDMVDRLHYFVAQLKERGVYSDINLLVSRQFKASDGLPPDIEKLGWKEQAVMGFFDKDLLALQKEYAKQLLTAPNPYTKLALCEDPGVAFVEINNENGLIHSWLGNVLEHLPPFYEAELRGQWNAWLKAKYKSSAELSAAWGGKKEPLGAELFLNADFAKNLDDWTLEQHEQAKASVSVEIDPAGKEKFLKLAVTETSTQGWHVQFNQTKLAVKKSQLYTLTFRARCDQPLTLSASLMQAHAPWQGLGWGNNVALTKEWQEFSFTFTATEDDDNARINFSNLGSKKITLGLAGLTFKPGGVVGLKDNEKLEDGAVPLIPHDGPRAWPEKAKADYVRFLWETEQAYWQGMYHYLKDELKVKALIFGTIVANSPPNIQGQLDVVDTHAYWQHPHFPHQAWDPNDWIVENKSMVNERGGGILGGLAQQRVAGKPLVCTEYNHCAPNEFASEAPLLAAAYASLQDWDGFFLFDYAPKHDGKLMGFFDNSSHPGKMANLILAANIFRRGDVVMAKASITVPFPVELELDTILKKGYAWGPANLGHVGVSADLALLQRIALQPAKDGPAAVKLPALPDTKALKRFASDTGELVWDLERDKHGLVSIDAPKTKALVGYIEQKKYTLGDVTFAPGVTKEGWCTLGLTIMEGDSFRGPARIVVVATGTTENSKMKWKLPEHNTLIGGWGEAPVLVEVIPAEITLPAPAAKVKAWALDEKGAHKDALKVEAEGERAKITFGAPAATLWYEITIEK